MVNTASDSVDSRRDLFQMLQYNSSYHLHCSLSLKSGRIIILEELAQQMTYAGLLEGTPSAVSNRWTLDTALKDAERVRRTSTVWIVDPPRRDCFRKPGDMTQIAKSHWLPEWMPLVRCIGVFTSTQPARDKRKDFSTLTIVWFQDEYALPILEPALSAIQAVDWESFAADREYGC